MQRLIISMGFGQGHDAQTAALRAVQSAQGRAEVSVIRPGKISATDVTTTVTLAAPDPAAVDVEQLKTLFDGGGVQVSVTQGGMAPMGTDPLVVCASVEVFVPVQAP